MTMVKEYEQSVLPMRAQVHESDLIRELGRRLGSIYGYDRNIASADGHPDLLEFWQGIRSQENRNIDRLKQLINSTSSASALRCNREREE